MNPKRHHTWFKPLVTSAFDNDSLHDGFAYEGFYIFEKKQKKKQKKNNI
jgi:hypothetical protein